MGMSITESVQESLVYIGMTKNLQGAIAKQVAEVLAKRPPGSNDWLNNAEKEALAQGRRLMVSWAEVEISKLALYKAALLLAFKEETGHLPGIMGRNGKWVPGAVVVPKKRELVGDLDWQGWYPMDDRSTIDRVPKGPGVWRVRAE